MFSSFEGNSSESSRALTAFTSMSGCYPPNKKTKIRSPQRARSRPIWDNSLSQKIQAETWLQKLDLQLINFGSEKPMADRLQQISSDLKEYIHVFNDSHLFKLTILLSKLWQRIGLKEDSQDFYTFYRIVKKICSTAFKANRQKTFYQENYPGLWLEIIMGVEAKIFAYTDTASKAIGFAQTQQYFSFLTQSNEDYKLFMESRQLFSIMERCLKCNILQVRSLVLDKLHAVVTRCSKAGIFYHKNNLLHVSKLLFRMMKYQKIEINVKISKIFSKVGHQSRFKALFLKEDVLPCYIEAIRNIEADSRAWDLYSDLVQIMTTKDCHTHKQRDETLKELFLQQGGMKLTRSFRNHSRQINQLIDELMQEFISQEQ